MQAHVAVNFHYRVCLSWCMSGVWIPQGFSFPWDQLLRIGELWPSNQAAACLWGVACLANPIDYNSNVVAVVKSLRKRCNLQAKGTWGKFSNNSWHSPDLKEEFDLFLKTGLICCPDWSPLKGCGCNLTRRIETLFSSSWALFGVVMQNEGEVMDSML